MPETSPEASTAEGLTRLRGAAMAPDQAAEQARIETEISTHRAAYLRAVWAGHSGEADWHETRVDQLIGEWDQLRRDAARKAEHA